MNHEREQTISDDKVFSHLLEIAEKDNSGVSACIVRKGGILASITSFNSGGVIVHAEQNLLGLLEQKHIKIEEDDVLYTTLEPCSARFDSTGGAPDCTTLIQRAGIRNVVYSACDPIQTIITHKRCDVFGINLRQIDNLEIQEKARGLFNNLQTGYRL